MASSTALRDFGYTYLSPLLAQYFMRVRTSVTPTTTLVCLAREGFAFRHILSAMQGAGHLPPDTTLIYLKVSRLLVFKACLASDNLRELCVATRYEGTLASFLQGRLGLSPLFVEELLSVEEKSEKIKLPKHGKKVLSVLHRHRDALRRETRGTAEALNQHLEDSGLRTGSHAPLFLDLGFSGTIQTLLTSILERDTKGLYLMASNPGTTRVGPWKAEMAGSFVEGLRIGDGYRPLDRSLFLECLLTAPHGPVMDITRAPDGSLTFHYGPEAAGQRQHHLLQEVFAGATAGVLHAFEHGIEWSKEELEALLERQVSDLWCIPSPLRTLFTTDDSICGNGTLSPIQFYQL